MQDVGKLRLDKWLWAARFFKTRSLAKSAIEGGKVHCGGERCKASKEIRVGDQLQIRQGFDQRSVEVLQLSDQRRGAPSERTNSGASESGNSSGPGMVLEKRLRMSDQAPDRSICWNSTR